jgi:hypothetical protein
MYLVSAAALAGNVLIKKEIEGENYIHKSSFESTDHTTNVSSINWTKVYAVCRYDCLFSGFEGTINNLMIDGKMVKAGSIKVTNSTIELDKLGKVTVYIGPDIFLLVLTSDQVNILEKP